MGVSTGITLEGAGMTEDDDIPCLVPCWPICCEDCPFGELGEESI